MTNARIMGSPCFGGGMCLSGNQPSRTLSYQQGCEVNPTRANFRDQRRIEIPIVRPECSEPRAYIAPGSLLGVSWKRESGRGHHDLPLASRPLQPRSTAAQSSATMFGAQRGMAIIDFPTLMMLSDRGHSSVPYRGTHPIYRLSAEFPAWMDSCTLCRYSRGAGTSAAAWRSRQDNRF